VTEFGEGLTSYFAILTGQVLAVGQPPRFFTYSNTIGLADHITERETYLYVLDEAARANDCRPGEVVVLFYRVVPNHRADTVGSLKP